MGNAEIIEEKVERELTERERALRDYLLNKGDKAHVTELCRNLSQYYTLDERITAHDPCIVLRNDVLNINLLLDGECFICQDHNYNYWIARNDKDAEQCANVHLEKALRYFQKYWRMKRKAELNGQMFTLDFKNVIEKIYIPKGEEAK